MIKTLDDVDKVKEIADRLQELGIPVTTCRSIRDWADKEARRVVKEKEEAKTNYKSICSVADNYLGAPESECEVDFDKEIACSAYYTQKQPDTDHPTELPRVCGNCMQYSVVKR